MPVLFLSTDLVFSSRLTAAGQRLSVPVSAVSSLDAAVARLKAETAGLVILDLSAGNSDVVNTVARLRETRGDVAIIAYAPHVHEELLRAATQAGCDQVLTRGQFNARMDEILAHYAQAK
jgi:DNA-binding NarL/FixJ family response regulator